MIQRCAALLGVSVRTGQELEQGRRAPSFLMAGLAIVTLVFAVAAHAQQPVRLAIRGATVVDVTDGSLHADRIVLVAADRVRAVGRTGKVEVPPGATIVDASGKFLIPGLWDMHVHTPSDAEARGVHFPLAIANGITGMRVMWGRPFNLVQRVEIQSGKLLGPRMMISTPMFDGRMWKGTLHVASPEEARRTVMSLSTEGYDFVKTYQFLPRDVYLAIAAEARRLGIPFAGHVPLAMSVAEASEAGQRSIEHAIGLALACSRDETRLRRNFTEAEEKLPPYSFAEHVTLMLRADAEPLPTLDPVKCAAVATTLRKNGTWIVPTLALFRGLGAPPDSAVREDTRLKHLSREIRERFASSPPNPAAESLRPHIGRLATMMRRAGVGVLAGTDTPNPYVLPGFGLHDELMLLVEAGFTPLEALQAATIDPARFLGATDSMGTIGPGKAADLVLLDANPLADIRNTQRIRAVVLNGRLLDRGALDKLLAGAAAMVP